jgi:hypothetical protein
VHGEKVHENEFRGLTKGTEGIEDSDGGYWLNDLFWSGLPTTGSI